MLKSLFSAVLLICLFAPVQADELSAIVQARVLSETEKAKSLALDPVIVKAVKEFNANKPVQLRAITQTTWEGLSSSEAVVSALSNNATAQFLRSHVSDTMSEAFISGADGTKVAFLAKTTNWNHSGAPKHEEPMQGKVWQGKVDRDLSADVLQLQVGVPVMDNGKPIGSLVIGLKVRQLNARHASSSN